ncbi:glycosyltransferase N-terminal domain-containing protein [Psychromarinibacter sp. C21-152]|uniref:3-deoxy-D-manno-octulosonic acid transferase n=1 Tax=Psychromarinibacter sediminicola TaxID=3033385 RepID=A0AAE3T908_9RHOB|nr:glycosyltransferase N-terminal domain-containing protein [Psychromarinibacter sediminicola]MDF0600085.1 glycosyltransferase N-terminal domain-containing protein [Psychromarinibacter sediminicola]
MRAYRLFLALAAPLALLRLWLRRLRGRDSAADLAQRLGRGSGTPGAIWLHGASNGELASARPLIAALLHTVPDTPLVVTANTASGRALVAGWGLPRVTARLAPLDTRAALRRFRRAWRPRLLIVMENELWPNRLATAREPVACIGARMSARSFRRWHRFPRTAARLLRHIAYLAPQDAESARHFAALGLPEDRLGPTGTLKSAVDLPAPDPETLAALARTLPRETTILAASTHEGEEEQVLRAFAHAHRRDPARRLILAPRHPARGATIASLIDKAGFVFARRSACETPGPDTAVYLADTLGEMPLWYALAGVTFVGGSLVPRGGHTPFEPAAAGSAILHGPDTANFAAPYAALDAAGGAIAVADADALAGALQRLSTAAAQADQADRARAALARRDGGTALISEITATLRDLLDR